MAFESDPDDPELDPDDLPLHPVTIRWLVTYARARGDVLDAVVADLLAEYNALLHARDAAAARGPEQRPP